VTNLPVDPRSVPAARRLLRDALRGLPAEIADDAAVIVSELVTNAVRHTRTLLVLRIRRGGRILRVEVSDDCTEQPRFGDCSDVAGGRELTTGGRGMRIVRELADRWGTDRTPVGKTVWFEISLSRGASSAPVRPAHHQA
jgi:anti-sigma regulatory factor (Ser/Thr protein kinase)